jgi:hypothetical protein
MGNIINLARRMFFWMVMFVLGGYINDRCVYRHWSTRYMGCRCVSYRGGNNRLGNGRWGSGGCGSCMWGR